MDIEDKDVTISQVGRKMVRMSYRNVNDKGNVKEFSPSDCNEKIVKFIKKEKRQVGETVATLANLLLGNPHSSELWAFTLGWYNRKYFNTLETKYGEGELVFDEEPLDKDKLRELTAKGIKRMGQHMLDVAEDIRNGKGIEDQDIEDLYEDGELE